MGLKYEPSSEPLHISVGDYSGLVLCVDGDKFWEIVCREYIFLGSSVAHPKLQPEEG